MGPVLHWGAFSLIVAYQSIGVDASWFKLEAYVASVWVSHNQQCDWFSTCEFVFKAMLCTKREREYENDRDICSQFWHHEVENSANQVVYQQNPNPEETTVINESDELFVRFQIYDKDFMTKDDLLYSGIRRLHPREARKSKWLTVSSNLTDNGVTIFRATFDIKIRYGGSGRHYKNAAPLGNLKSADRIEDSMDEEYLGRPDESEKNEEDFPMENEEVEAAENELEF